MISEKDVKYVADLARIHLHDTKIKCLTKDLEKILGYIQKLNMLDITDVHPTNHVLPLKNVYREDKIKPSLTQQTALKISIEQREGSFKVPKVLE